jgi:hypothetical protein
VNATTALRRGSRGVAQRREARPGDQLGLGHQLLQQRPDRIGAEEHGLVPAARAQQAIGEDVAALGIGAELDLVDREEAHLETLGHRFDRGDEVARGSRLDPLLAGDQRDRGRPLLGHDPVVDLARQQAQREADQAAAMRQHPLDREVGLAGVGRPEHGEHARAVGWQQRHAMTMRSMGGPGKGWVLPQGAAGSRTASGQRRRAPGSQEPAMVHRLHGA